jgi:hypothetical protein
MRQDRGPWPDETNVAAGRWPAVVAHAGPAAKRPAARRAAATKDLRGGRKGRPYEEHVAAGSSRAQRITTDSTLPSAPTVTSTVTAVRESTPWQLNPVAKLRSTLSRSAAGSAPIDRVTLASFQ